MRLDQIASSFNKKLDEFRHGCGITEYAELEILDALSEEILDEGKDIKEALINMFNLGKFRSDLEKKEKEMLGITKGIISHQLIERESRELLMKCMTKWGDDTQINQALEELSELSVVLLKRKRVINGSTIDEIVDEIADVFICIHQLRLMYTPDEIDKVVKKKMERLQKFYDGNSIEHNEIERV